MQSQIVELHNNREVRVIKPSFANTEGQNKNEKNEAQKGLKVEEATNEELFEEAVNKTQKELFRCKTVFPFDFFPNEIIIDITKITVIDRSFFMTGGIQSIYLKDIYDVEVETGPFFSTLLVSDQYFSPNKLEVKYLKKKDALKSREIMSGIICAIKMGIDLTKIDSSHLESNLRELSRSQRAMTL